MEEKVLPSWVGERGSRSEKFELNLQRKIKECLKERKADFWRRLLGEKLRFMPSSNTV